MRMNDGMSQRVERLRALGEFEAASQSTAVAACTLTWRKPGSSREELRRRATSGFEHSLARLAASWGDVMYALFVVGTPAPPSAVFMYRRLWKIEALKSMPSGIERGAEAKIECGGTVRFAGLARVPLGDLSWLVANLHSFQIIIPFLVRTPLPTDEEVARRLASAAVPPARSLHLSDLDWPGLAQYVASSGGICVRWTNDLSIPELEADFFVADADAEQLHQFLERANGDDQS